MGTKTLTAEDLKEAERLLDLMEACVERLKTLNDRLDENLNKRARKLSDRLDASLLANGNE